MNASISPLPAPSRKLVPLIGLPAVHQLMLFTTIRVYGNHILKDYDSGLTCPRPLSTESTIKPGDTIQFHYELGSHPRLNGHVVEPCTPDDLRVVKMN